MQAFEFLFTCQMSSTQKGGAFVNNEFDDVYLVRLQQYDQHGLIIMLLDSVLVLP